MSDFATLVMTTDSTGLKQGEQALDSLAAKGEQTETRVTKSTGNLSKEFDRVVAAIGGVTDAQAKANDLAGQQVAALQKLIEQTHGLGTAAAAAVPPVEEMKAAIAEVGVEAQKTAKTYQAVNQMFTGASSSTTAMQAQIDALTGVSRGANAAASSAAVFAAKFEDAAKKAKKGATETGTAASLADRRVQQFGWQLGQVTQQGAVTGNYLQALAIQMGDILPMLGVGGAAGVGIMAAAIAAPLATSLFAGVDAADAMEDALDNLNDRIDEYSRFAKLANASSKDLAEQFGSLSGLAREMYEGMAKLAHIKALQETKAAADELRQQFAGLKVDLGDIAESMKLSEGGGLETARYLIEGISEKYGLTVDQARELMQLIDQMGKGGTMREQADAAAEVAKFLQDAVTNGADLKAETMDGAVAATNYALSVAEIAANTDDAGAATVSATAATDEWASAMASVNAQLAGAYSLLSSIGGGMIQRAGISAANAVLDAGGGAIAAEKARRRAEERQRLLNEANTFEGFRSADMIDAEVAELERQWAAQDEYETRLNATRASERASSRRGGGRKGRGGSGRRERANEYERSVQDIQAETEAFLRQADAMAKVVAAGGDWEHALAVIEEEQKLLNAAQKAGIPITDEMKVKVKEMAEAHVSAEETLDRLRTATEKGQDAMKDFFGSVLDGADAAKEAIANLLAEIAKVQFAKGMMGLLGATSWGSSLVQGIGALQSFDGGGDTGSGPRTGGLDGKGGFLAMMHPDETVFDRTKGQSAAANVHVTVGIDQSGNLYVRQIAQQEAASMGKAVSASIKPTIQQYQANPRRNPR